MMTVKELSIAPLLARNIAGEPMTEIERLNYWYQRCMSAEKQLANLSELLIEVAQSGDISQVPSAYHPPARKMEGPD
jgi:hypothetical protein